MKTSLHVVDAFTDRPFAGNSAAVCLLNGPADEKWMQLVAREMNLSETAFLHPIDGGYSLRWFTPAVEVKLCGHATLASAFALWQTGVLDQNQAARFFTLSGWLTCVQENGWIAMDFPACPVSPCQTPPGLEAALGARIQFCGSNGMDHLVEVASETALRGLSLNFATIKAFTKRGLIVTCQSHVSGLDFLSRFFAPAAGIDEDPVTGSAHCALGPYWQAQLGKADFTAFQASERGGLVKLSVRDDRVILRGQAVLMSRVELL
jgi:PhzF family phenazine biosynthesis protein